MLVASEVASPLGAGATSQARLDFVGSFFVDDNLKPGEDLNTPTSAEIVDLTPDGRTLVYTDAFTSRLGFVDVSNPSAPAPLGALDLPGSPTSVAIHRGWALVAIVTSADPDGAGPLNAFDAPDGSLVVVDLATRTIVRTIALGGQPDSIAVSPNGGRYAAIVIENERDEDENDGLLPQLPAGSLKVLDLGGQPGAWGLRTVALTGLATIAPSDPEPEFVDINRRDEAVVSLQENNHLVIVDLRRAKVIRHFSAGTTSVKGVDATEEKIGPQDAGLIELADSLEDRRREPDAVAWIDDDSFATANEGDYADADGIEGGSRSFTIFSAKGKVEFEAGNSLEYEAVRAGHFPEARAANKGIEPEGLEVGRFGGRTYLFVAAERADIVGVYDVSGDRPRLVQLLPTGIGPEGLKFTRDGLLAVTAETDGADDGFLARPLITLFEAGANTDWHYPQIVSATERGKPIPWVALSGLSGDPADRDTLWGVSDSYLAQAWLYKIDVSHAPAVIRERIRVGGTDVLQQVFGDYDLEGVAARPEGGFWFASEGRTNAGSSRPNLVLRADASGTVIGAYPLPAALVATANSSGFEGVTVTGTAAAGNEVVWVAIQRPWTGDPVDRVKIGRLDVATGTWTFALYPLDAAPAVPGAVVGLSEITALPDGTFAIIERDNQLGQLAQVKRIYGVDPSSVAFAAFGAPLPTLAKTLLRDVHPDLDAASISVPDKVEGLGLTSDQRVFIVTDNDGVDENYGETVFVGLGSLESAFDPH
jgi:hypothetical protein